MFFGYFILYFSAVLFCFFRVLCFTSTPLPSTSPARSPYSLYPRGSRYGSPRDKRSISMPFLSASRISVLASFTDLALSYPLGAGRRSSNQIFIVSSSSVYLHQHFVIFCFHSCRLSIAVPQYSHTPLVTSILASHLGHLITWIPLSRVMTLSLWLREKVSF